MTDLICRCVNVARTYGSGRTATVALHGTSGEVAEGDRIAIIGPSGSGKSTLLHLMAGLDRATAGTVDWPALGPAERLRPGPVAVIFQGPSLLGPLDVIENVALPLLLGGASEAKATDAARRALVRLDLSALAAKLPEELSGGQAQRVAVARALAGNPRFILADEPTGQLDHVTAGQVVDVLIAAAGDCGAALVVATHDPVMADRLRQRWALIDGRLQLPAGADSRGSTPCSA
ncbi:MAG: ATP-binding cassette domain-containing protein [Actinomycetota bacterium]|nr:ATP-binding cassette domain-containing protein [Actinomycetota bacterium]